MKIKSRFEVPLLMTVLIIAQFYNHAYFN